MTRAPEAIREQARMLRARGRSYAAIARRLGYSRGSIARWCDPTYAERLRVADRERLAARAEVVAGIKRERGCTDCGTRDGLLHFDHRPGEQKLFNISAAHSTPWPVVLAEIAKCDVRCVSCHSRRHWRDRRNAGAARPGSSGRRGEGGNPFGATTHAARPLARNMRTAYDEKEEALA